MTNKIQNEITKLIQVEQKIKICKTNSCVMFCVEKRGKIRKEINSMIENGIESLKNKLDMNKFLNEAKGEI